MNAVGSLALSTTSNASKNRHFSFTTKTTNDAGGSGGMDA